MSDGTVSSLAEDVGVDGFLYQFHLSEPLGDVTRPRMSASHYLGWAKDEASLARRIEHHRRGTAGVAFTRAAFERGIELVLVWTAPGSRVDERRMKKAGHHHRRCSLCKTACKES